MYVCMNVYTCMLCVCVCVCVCVREIEREREKREPKFSRHPKYSHGSVQREGERASRRRNDEEHPQWREEMYEERKGGVTLCFGGNGLG